MIIAWSEAFDVGIPEIDNQHRELIETFNHEFLHHLTEPVATDLEVLAAWNYGQPRALSVKADT